MVATRSSLSNCCWGFFRKRRVSDGLEYCRRRLDYSLECYGAGDALVSLRDRVIAVRAPTISGWLNQIFTLVGSDFL
jgi:hypothetical protein